MCFLYDIKVLKTYIIYYVKWLFYDLWYISYDNKSTSAVNGFLSAFIVQMNADCITGKFNGALHVELTLMQSALMILTINAN